MSSAVEKQCFVIMPISDPDDYSDGHFRRVYDHLIRPACSEAGLVPFRADDVRKTNHIIIDILRKILESDVVLCDLSAKNPNVLYELGIRQAFNRPAVLIKDRRTDRIFDIQGLRTLDYDESLRVDTVKHDVNQLKTALAETLTSSPDDVNSLIQLLGIRKAELRTTTDVSPETSLLLDSLKDISQRITRLEELRYSHPIPVSAGTGRRANRMKSGLPNGEIVFGGQTVYDDDGTEMGVFNGYDHQSVLLIDEYGDDFAVPPDDERYAGLTCKPTRNQSAE